MAYLYPCRELTNCYLMILTTDNLEKTAKEFLARDKGCHKFAFYGEMGAGKTTFITALCNELKALDLVSSPTFSIVNEYERENGGLIYHFDFYRIESAEELYDIGFEEYLSENNYCFVEWPEKADELLPSDFARVRINILPDGNREVSYI